MNRNRTIKASWSDWDDLQATDDLGLGYSWSLSADGSLQVTMTRNRQWVIDGSRKAYYAPGVKLVEITGMYLF